MIGRNSSALGLLRLLLVASILAPVCLVVAIGWSTYRAAYGDARRQAIWTSGIAREHAARAFDSQELVTERVFDLIRDKDDGAIEASEPALHDRLQRIIADLPQFRSIGIVDRAGRLLAASAVHPVPADVDISDRDYFKALKANPDQSFVTQVQAGRPDDTPFFGLAKARRDPQGAFDGLIDIAISPAPFQGFYNALVKEEGERSGRVLMMIRSDGQILVRYPAYPGRTPVESASDAFMTAIRANPEGGIYRADPTVDEGAPDRLYAYRRVEGYPLYIVSGRNVSAIRAQWLSRMGLYLGAVVPATAVMVLMILVALRRTRREQEALALLKEEMRRREIAEEALGRSQRLEAVGQLTGGIAHDFNNLLTIIVGNVDMMVRRAGDAERVKRLGGNVLLAARRVADVTDKLLAFSRRRVVRPETISINSIVADLQPLLGRAVNQTIEIACQFEPELCPVRVDPGQFEAALINLVVNARDAMAGGGKIVIATTQADLAAGDLVEAPELAPGRYVTVSVADTGSGMSPETLAKAFEPFFTTKDVGKGTGLGLSQVYGFAKQAGGHARIVSRLGRGTTVELILPRSLEAVSEDRHRAEATPPRRAERGEVIMVVEDEASLRAMAVESLQDLGYRTLSAGNAAQAMAQLREEIPVDLIFSDIVMPGGTDGIALVADARKLRPELIVLLTSGYADAAAGHHIPDDVPLLRKPYLREQLAAEIGRLLAPPAGPMPDHGALRLAREAGTGSARVTDNRMAGP